MAVIGLLSSSTQPRQELPAQGSQYIARLIRPDAPDRGREPRPKPWKPCSPRERLPAARSFAIAILSCSSLDSPYLGSERESDETATFTQLSSPAELRGTDVGHRHPLGHG